tara:strand:+ start:1148 stop:1792 length:645 start_codon:yes stop_codon:yes gene_type:complete
MLVVFGLMACTNMDVDLDTGKEARRAENYELAAKHLGPLAEFGVEEAKYEYALTLIRKEDSTEDDYKSAMEYLKSVRGKRTGNALFEIGSIYEKGLGVEKDYDLALDYYKLSYESGYIRGLYQSGSVFEKKKDYEQALALYKKALDGKFAKAAYRIGRLYERGRLGKKDPVLGLAWYIHAENLGVKGMPENIKKIKSRLDASQIAEAYEISRGL